MSQNLSQTGTCYILIALTGVLATALLASHIKVREKIDPKIKLVFTKTSRAFSQLNPVVRPIVDITKTTGRGACWLGTLSFDAASACITPIINGVTKVNTKISERVQKTTDQICAFPSNQFEKLLDKLENATQGNKPPGSSHEFQSKQRVATSHN